MVSAQFVPIQQGPSGMRIISDSGGFTPLWTILIGVFVGGGVLTAGFLLERLAREFSGGDTVITGAACFSKAFR